MTCPAFFQSALSLINSGSVIGSKISGKGFLFRYLSLNSEKVRSENWLTAAVKVLFEELISAICLRLFWKI